MKNERGWTDEEIDKRIQVDKKKFKNFIDYNVIITNPDF
jgi:hypothetical protein